MRHLPLIAAILVAAVLAPVAASADRMWVGFHDDPMFRFDEDRASEIQSATATNNASVLRTLVTWANVASKKPAKAANPFDPAYKLDDLDEFVRNAQVQNAEVLITIWGTPKWANGGKSPNFLPTSMSTFQNFTKALASRYSGRYPGYPFVRFFGIWNESNLGNFLSPQFNSKGRSSALPPTRSSPPPAMPGSRPATRRHSWPSARRPPTGATSGRRARPTPCGRERSQRVSPRRTSA